MNAELIGIITSEVDDGAFFMMMKDKPRVVFTCIIMAEIKDTIKDYKVGSMVKVLGNIEENNHIAVHGIKLCEEAGKGYQITFTVLDTDSESLIIEFDNGNVCRLYSKETLDNNKVYTRNLKPIVNSYHWRMPQ